MRLSINRVLGCLAAGWLCVHAAGAPAAENFMLTHELWDRPRTARVILEQPGVKPALRQHLGQPGSRLVIHHALGQEALLQAEELRVWLMALAVDGARIGLSNDARQNEPLRIEIVK